MKILKALGIILAILVVLTIVLVLAMPTKYYVERSVLINAPRPVVFDQVRFYKNFIRWSPWSKMDPDMSYEISEPDGIVGSVYSWSGNDSVGVGSLTTLSQTENRIDQKLDFSSPRESHDETYYTFEDTPDGVRVAWGVRGNLVRPMNLMKLFINLEDMIGSDFEEGLKALELEVKDYVTTHTKRGYLIYEKEMKPTNYIIKRDYVTFDDIQNFYGTHFDAILQMVQMLGLIPTGPPTGIFYHWDMQNNRADMAAGIPIEGEADIEGYDMVRIGGKALFIPYYGSYSGSAEAHNALDDFMRQNKLTLNNVVLEEYVTDPGTEPDSSKRLTNIYYLVK